VVVVVVVQVHQSLGRVGPRISMRNLVSSGSRYKGQIVSRNAKRAISRSIHKIYGWCTHGTRNDHGVTYVTNAQVRHLVQCCRHCHYSSLLMRIANIIVLALYCLLLPSAAYLLLIDVQRYVDMLVPVMFATVS